MIEIIPSILTKDPSEVKELLKRCEGVSDRVSIDIIDGKFANNKTLYPDFYETIETDLKIDYQLMVEEPINWVEKCVRGQADRIIGHIEKMSDQVEFIGKVQEIGAGVGLALDLKTPIDEIDNEIFSSLDIILLMSVPAGFGGQKFDNSVIEKVKKLSEIRVRDDTPFKIQIDGGVNQTNIYNIHKAGVDEVSVGRYLFKGDLKTNISSLQNEAHRKN